MGICRREFQIGVLFWWTLALVAVVAWWCCQTEGVVEHNTALRRPLPLFCVEVNAAPWPEFDVLPGLGVVTGKAIVADRAKRGPFASIEEILRVDGIGPKRLERARPYFVCRPIE